MDDVKLENLNLNSRYQPYRREQKRRRDDESSSESSSGTDDDNLEELEDYDVDGYHPAHVGEIIDSKYVILKKLGWGHFSTVWLAFKLSDKQLYALKI